MSVPGAAPGVDAVVFDLGNVLVRWDPYGPYEGRLPRAAVDAFFRDVDFPAFNHLQDAGRPWAHARADVQARMPQHVPALDLYVEHFRAALPGPVPGSADLVRELRAQGVRVLGLTNWSAETFHHAEPAAPAIGLLEAVLVSGEVGLAKPDPRIYRLLAERFSLDPARTVFLDDSAANVAAAAAEGFAAVLFTTAPAARAELAARAVRV
ncbi:HAD-IA family hydrolase [Cellulomonas sp. 179-A 4D5 NHS]|uniref:HAD-IA family hydrolase n=1 Tax=Cellulomonas sp. 179-A 4D5 NHS TaxID=3142378 RepID=UPI0039A083F5